MKWGEVCSWRLYKNQITLLLIVLTVPRVDSQYWYYPDVKELVLPNGTNDGNVLTAFCPYERIYVINVFFKHRAFFLVPMYWVLPNSTYIERQRCANSRDFCTIPVSKSSFAGDRHPPFGIQYFCVKVKYLNRTFVPENNPRTAQAIEGSELTISCSDDSINSRINIIYAGTRDHTVDECGNESDGCFLYSSRKNITQWCNIDSENCSIPVNRDVLGFRPRSGYRLHISYRCISGNMNLRETVYEGRVLTISCTIYGFNSRIDIVDAKIQNYGSCKLNATSIARKWCGSDSQNCSIPFNDTVFNLDGCFLLEVHYSCIPSELVNTTLWTEARTTGRQGISATETAAGDALKIGLGLTLSLVFVILVLIGVIIYIVKRKQSNSQSKDVKDQVHYSDIKDHYAEIEEPNQSKGIYTAPVPVNIFNKHIYKDLEPSSSPVQNANAAAY